MTDSRAILNAVQRRRSIRYGFDERPIAHVPAGSVQTGQLRPGAVFTFTTPPCPFNIGC
jgi:hypothetical protein